MGVFQTLTATTDEKGYGLHNGTHPLPLDRLARLDAAMGTRFYAMPGLVDEVPSFVAQRNPPPPVAPPASAAKPKRPKS